MTHPERPDYEVPQDQLESAVDDVVADFVRENAPGVALLIGQGGRVRLSKGYGLADVDRKIPITPQTRFIIASVTKQFVCTAIMMLEQKGLLDYDEPVARFFPGFPGWRHRVTLRHLMTHTGGIHEYLTDRFWQECTEHEFDQDEVIARIGGFEQLDFAPGSVYRYSNSGYIMLGAVIEQVAGQPFKQFMSANVFEPLGMQHTQVGDSGTRLDRQAVGYVYRGPSDFSEAPYNRSVVGWADGNIISTVEDMFLWDRALYTDRLLPGWVLGQAFSPVNAVDPSFSRYGFGWTNNLRRGVRELWHSGGTLGYTTRFARFVDDDMCVVLFSNGDGMNLTELHGALTEILLHKRMTPVAHRQLDPAQAEQLLRDRAGTYVDRLGESIASDRNTSIVVAYDAELHTLTVSGLARVNDGTRLLPVEDRLFHLDNRSDQYVEFLAGDHGDIVGLRFYSNGSVTNLARRS